MPRTYEKTEYGVTYKYQIIRPRNGTGEETHPVFKNKKDFETFFFQKDGFIPPFHNNWRTAEEGVWTQGDGKEEVDRGIVQILRKVDKIHHPEDNEKRMYAPRGYCRTIVGTFLCNDNREMTTDFEKITNRYRFDKKSHALTIKKRQTNEELSMIDRQWILSVSHSNFKFETMAGIWLLLRDMEKTSQNMHKAKREVDKLLQREFVMNTLIKNIKKHASDHGIDLDLVLDNYYELATNSNRDDVRLNANDRCAQLIGLNAAIEKRDRKILEEDKDELPKSFDEYEEINGTEDIKNMTGNNKIEEAQVYEDILKENEIKEKQKEEEFKAKQDKKAKKINKDFIPEVNIKTKSSDNVDLEKYAV